MALAKFGRHADAFLPVVCLSNQTNGIDCRKRSAQEHRIDCAMEEAFRRFGSLGRDEGELIKRDLVREEIGKASSSEWLLLDELIVGSGNEGEYVSNTVLPATQSVDLIPGGDVLLAFRERLYQAHGVIPPLRRSRSDENRTSAKPLEVLITGNQRDTPKLLEAFQGTAAYLNSQGSKTSEGVAAMLRRHLNVRFVSWEDLQPWGEQLKVLKDIDILVSGIGSALFYSLLLPDGAAVVNLGYNRPLGAFAGETSAPAGAATFPSYGEEFLGMSNARVRTFYLPLDQVERGPSTLELSSLLEEAGAAVRKGFEIPLASPEENLGIFGKIILELQQRSESSRRGLAADSQNHLTNGDDNAQALPGHWLDQFRCHQRGSGQASAADLVYEQSITQAVIPEFRSQLSSSCHIDLQLLRQLKVKYRLKDALGVTAQCECIVCEACGRN